MDSDRSITRPNSFIFTLYGDVVHRGGPARSLWIGALVRLMASFGLTEAAVRQAVSRMSRQGWLRAERVGGRAYYAVTERGARRIEELSPRIYGPVVEWDGRWRMLAYAIAERQREKRDRLRKDLAVLGWAPLTSALWLSPRDALSEVTELATAAGAIDDVNLFVAYYAGPATDRELLQACWDVDAIARAYRDFIHAYEPRLTRERERHGLSDEAAFVERLWLVHDFRKFTYIDPGLPSTLLPAHWPGTTAAAVFREYYAALEDKALRFFSGIAGGQAAHA
jgi:phenylacetic acid degradation operon negative regulatory protein